MQQRGVEGTSSSKGSPSGLTAKTKKTTQDKEAVTKEKNGPTAALAKKKGYRPGQRKKNMQFSSTFEPSSKTRNYQENVTVRTV